MDVALYQDTSDPQRPYQPGPEGDERPAREPMFNAPWPALALVVLIVGGYAVQSRFPVESFVDAFAFSPANLTRGRWVTLFTALFVHGGWAHALMNAAFALAFATPVARFFGERASGAIFFFAFYLMCGALSNLGYAALHWGSAEPLVGASGALSGLMGATARLIAGRGRLGRVFSSPVLTMGAAWVVVNLLIGIVGSGFVPGTGGASVAWEAHLTGFLAGVLAIGPVAWLARRD
jgi:membrane associated rhomboid family serine protease